MLTIIELAAREDGGHGLQSQSHRTECWLEGWIAVPPELEQAAWDCRGYCELEVQDGVLTGLTPTQPPEEPAAYIPTEEQSTRVMLRAMLQAKAPEMEADELIACSGLVEDWAPGDHKVGEICNTRNGVHGDGIGWEQTWECFQAYDNAVYPDIAPGNEAWYTFERPLHGKSAETARPFVAPRGSHDIYRVGEHMVWTDGTVRRCLRDTSFGPDGEPDAWETVEA